jgi:protein N-terminal methyltransferase
MAARRQQINELADKIERDLKHSGLPLKGHATDGTQYSSLKQMWLQQLDLQQRSSAKKQLQEALFDDDDASPTAAAATAAAAPAKGWYERGYDYWEDEANCSLSLDGVLGGYGSLSPADIEGSRRFLQQLRSARPNLGSDRCADCGAGIGRISKELLLPLFTTVDLVEQSPRLLAAAPKYIGKELRACANYVCIGLQDFFPEAGCYDVIWFQWVVGHLHDLDFIKCLKRCQLALALHGVIVIKDNCCSSAAGDSDSSADATTSAANNSDTDAEQGDDPEAFVVDSDDSSLTRSLGYYRSLFKHAGLQIVMQQQEQAVFPDEIFPVFYFALC